MVRVALPGVPIVAAPVAALSASATVSSGSSSASDTMVTVKVLSAASPSFHVRVLEAVA